MRTHTVFLSPHLTSHPNTLAWKIHRLSVLSPASLLKCFSDYKLPISALLLHAINATVRPVWLWLKRTGSLIWARTTFGPIIFPWESLLLPPKKEILGPALTQLFYRDMAYKIFEVPPTIHIESEAMHNWTGLNGLRRLSLALSC